MNEVQGLQLDLRLSKRDNAAAIACALRDWERTPDVKLNLAGFMLLFQGHKDRLLAQTEEERAARYPWTGEGY